ncbi:putative reverse transcriptase domain-containing protein [Tanacetum coccineum]
MRRSLGSHYQTEKYLVLEESPEEKVRHSKSAKVKEQKLKDIVVVRNFFEVFPDDLSEFLPSREIEFHIDLIPGAMPVAKSPHLHSNALWFDECTSGIHGHDEQSLHVDSSKIEVVKNWEAPRTPSEYVWREEQERAFQTLKDKLCNAPVLALLDRSEDFVLKIHEKNYTTHDLELEVVVFSLKIWIHYLFGTKSVIYTDHKSLQHIFNQKELNMRQRRWIELFSDYDCEIRYHPGKENVVVDALSQKEIFKPNRIRAMNMTIQSSIKDKILAAQNKAFEVVNVPAEMLRGLDDQMEHRSDGALYSVHPGANKMYYDLRDMYWWPGMKKDIAMYVSKCLTCYKIKAEHKRPSGLLQQPKILEWKWERIVMDFITKFPRTGNGRDAIWVIVERLTKSAYFLPLHKDFTMDMLARLYLNEIIARHEMPISIISDRDSRFTSKFWQSMQEALGTQLYMSTD